MCVCVCHLAEYSKCEICQQLQRALLSHFHILPLHPLLICFIGLMVKLVLDIQLWLKVLSSTDMLGLSLT